MSARRLVASMSWGNVTWEKGFLKHNPLRQQILINWATSVQNFQGEHLKMSQVLSSLCRMCFVCKAGTVWTLELENKKLCSSWMHFFHCKRRAKHLGCSWYFKARKKLSQTEVLHCIIQNKTNKGIRCLRAFTNFKISCYSTALSTAHIVVFAFIFFKKSSKFTHRQL